MRNIVRGSFRLFVVILNFFGLIRENWRGGLGALLSTEGKIVVANHPTLLDIVFLMSQVRRGDCIVKAALFRFPFVRLVVRRLYISNELEGEDLVAACVASLEAGNTLIIFPEGTRSSKGEIGKMKRGAARIAITSGRNCLPIRISVPDATGLRKGDRFFSSCAGGPMKFDFHVLTEIEACRYAKKGVTIGSRRMTDDLGIVLS